MDIYFHKKDKADIILDMITVMVVITVMVFTLYRCFFDAELTDEAYSVAEPYLVATGGLPFVDNWSQMPGFSLLLAPFTWVFIKFSGGTTGIFLFNRFMDQAINAFALLVVFKVILKHISDKRASMLFALPIFMALGGGLISFRGDDLSITLLNVASVLLVSSLLKHGKTKIYLTISGVLYALAVMCYPTLLIQYIFVIVLVIVVGKKEFGNFNGVLYFLLGSAIATVICTGYLVIRSSFSQLFFGIKLLLNDVAYFQLENDGISKLPGYIKAMAKESIYILIFVCIIFFFSIVVNILFLHFGKGMFKRNYNEVSISLLSLKKVFLISLTMGTILYLIYQVKRFGFTDNSNISLYVITGGYINAPFLLFFINKYKKLARLLFFTSWLPTGLWAILTGISSYSDLWGRNILLRCGAYLSILYMMLAFSDVFGNTDSQGTIKSTLNCRILTLLPQLIPVVFASVFCFANVFNAFSYIYRDSSLLSMTCRLDSGPYKGIYTAPERAEGLIEIERAIKENTSSNDYVLAMDNVPFVYLMTDGKPCTTSTWGQALYSHGFNQPNIYYDYFEITGNEPTKIIYSNYGQDEILSIDTDYYKFNQYVKKHFELVYENRDMIYPILIFSRVD